MKENITGVIFGTDFLCANMQVNFFTGLFGNFPKWQTPPPSPFFWEFSFWLFFGLVNCDSIKVRNFGLGPM